jgi:phage terminase large subunit-like protein
VSPDYVGRAFAYAAKALEDVERKRHGRWIRLAAQRFFRDFERIMGGTAPFTFDAAAANNACDFIEKLPHVEGTWFNADGSPQPYIVLHDSDIFFIVQLFGFRLPDGSRRFTTAIKAIARKNAKSTVAAAIALYCQCCEPEEGPQIISAATTYSQAAIIFKIAKRMAEKREALREQFNLEVFAKAIVSHDNGGTFQALHAKASTQDGLNPSMCVVDEVHAHPNGDLIEVLKSAAGARRNTLFLYTTTEGYDSPGPWGEMRHYMKQVLLGVITETDCDHVLCVYYALDEKDESAGITNDDDFDEDAWIKANPLMESNDILLREVRKQAAEAKYQPSKLAEFRIKRLNRPSSVAGGWVDLTKWKECGGPLPLDLLRQHRCWGGLDLASTNDITALYLVWLIEGRWYTWGRKWTPAAAISRRTRTNLVPYKAWAAAGHLTQAGDDVTDYKAVREGILSARKQFPHLQAIGYDTWNAKEVATDMEAAGIRMHEVIQGPKSYHPAMQALEVAYCGGNFCHGDDPVLNWAASNVVARTDQNLNKAPDKKKSNDKIDPMSALLMAIGTALQPVEETGQLDNWLKRAA